MHPVVQIMKSMYDAQETAHAVVAAKAVKKPKRPKLSKTEKVLVGMLTENTGCDILDSGGAYGRSWQRNQARAFWDEPETSLSFAVRNWNGEDHLEINVTHNVYHWLRSRLEYDPSMDRRFQAFRRRAENKDEYDLAIMESFPKHLTEKTGNECTGIHYDGEPMTVNTYNGEDLLSQTIQFILFNHDNVSYVILQIHGGCDVRGGYTRPRVFEVTGDSDETCMFDNARAGLFRDYDELKEKIRLDEVYRAENPVLPGTDPKWNSSPLREHEHSNWSTDDGCHWYYDGCCGASYRDKQLDKIPCKEIEKREDWEEGFVCVLPDGTGLCPFTGCMLHAGFY